MPQRSSGRAVPSSCCGVVELKEWSVRSVGRQSEQQHPATQSWCCRHALLQSKPQERLQQCTAGPHWGTRDLQGGGCLAVPSRIRVQPRCLARDSQDQAASEHGLSKPRLAITPAAKAWLC